MSKRNFVEEEDVEVEEDGGGGGGDDDGGDDDDDDEQAEEAKGTANRSAKKQRSKSSLYKSIRLEREKYVHGNYREYYTFRNGRRGVAADYRLKAFHRQWFEGKDCLDIGCNSGELTLEVVRRFQCRSMVGVDIDEELIEIAKKNRLNAFEAAQSQRAAPPMAAVDAAAQRLQCEHFEGALSFDFFPPSLLAKNKEMPDDDLISSAVNGGDGDDDGDAFPLNVVFLCNNAAAEDLSNAKVFRIGDLLFADGSRDVTKVAATAAAAATTTTATTTTVPTATTPPSTTSFPTSTYPLLEPSSYDVITCLSVTKWIHLNEGDDGIHRLFRRCYAALRPRGLLILEPQPFESYQKKRSVFRNKLNTIELKPELFPKFLVDEVGFCNFRELFFNAPRETGVGGGFPKRSLHVYTKY